jgi:hypothetical protein
VAGGGWKLSTCYPWLSHEGTIQRTCRVHDGASLRTAEYLIGDHDRVNISVRWHQRTCQPVRYRSALERVSAESVVIPIAMLHDIRAFWPLLEAAKLLSPHLEAARAHQARCADMRSHDSRSLNAAADWEYRCAPALQPA